MRRSTTNERLPVPALEAKLYSLRSRRAALPFTQKKERRHLKRAIMRTAHELAVRDKGEG